MNLDKEQLSAYNFLKLQIGTDSQLDWLLESVYLSAYMDGMEKANEVFNKILDK